MIHDPDGRDAGISSSERLSLILIALAATFLGAASFVYLVATDSAAVAHRPSGRLS